jgi:hypothetical protein
MCGFVPTVPLWALVSRPKGSKTALHFIFFTASKHAEGKEQAKLQAHDNINFAKQILIE